MIIRFVVLAIMLALLAGFFHVMFIMFDNAWYSESSGAIPKIADVFNDTLSSDNRNSTWNQTVMFRDAFGIGRVICIVLVPVCIGMEAIDKPRITG